MNRSELDNQMNELARGLSWSPSWHGLRLEEDDGSYYEEEKYNEEDNHIQIPDDDELEFD